MALGRPLFSGVARLFQSSFRSSQPGTPFWTRYHAFPQGGMRACKPRPWFTLVPQSAVGLTLTHATPASVISRSCGGIPEVPLGLLNLGFHFGSVVMPLLEVACVRAVLTR